MMNIINILCFAAMFIIGYFCGSDKRQKNEIQQAISLNSQVQTQATSKKVSTETKFATVTEKHYSHKGNITKEVVKHTYAAIQHQNHKTQIDQSTNNYQENKKVVESVVTNQKNWLVGLSTPIDLSFKPNFNKVDILVGYRLISDFYVTTQLQNFKTVSVGFQISL